MPAPGDIVTLKDWPERAKKGPSGKMYVPSVNGKVIKVEGKVIHLYTEHAGTNWSNRRALPLSHLVKTAKKAREAAAVEKAVVARAERKVVKRKTQ